MRGREWGYTMLTLQDDYMVLFIGDGYHFISWDMARAV